MTLLVTSLAPADLETLEASARQAWAGGTDAIEIRIDSFTDDVSALAAYLRAHRDRTWIVTCRGADEGGHSRGSTAQRVSRLVTAARGTNAYVDFEYADWQQSSDVREDLLAATSSTGGVRHRLILSSHDFKQAPKNLAGLAEKMSNVREAMAVKIAYTANHICDTFAAFDLAHARGSRVVPIAMGEEGVWTRLLAKKLGAFAAYCALQPETATAPGQVTLDEMVDRYRWRTIDQSTRVFGVVGDPVSHSMSPLLFNRWFADAGINAVYLPLLVRRNGSDVGQFLDGCRARPWLDIGGLSVTIPHKASALRWVGDGADTMARSIGAINTLQFHDGDARGFNTDACAAVSSLCDALGYERSDLAGVPIDLLGSGGAARALIYGLSEVGASVTVYGRSLDKTRRLAEECSATAAGWGDRIHRRGEILVNCTSVGMWPEFHLSPLPADSLKGYSLVFDVVYNPIETQLLKDAAEAGLSTLGGLDMFVRQAATQFELWTGEAADTQCGRDLVRCEVERRTGPS